jgi:hypothetical protein
LSFKKPIAVLICVLPLIFGVSVYCFENHYCSDTADRVHIYIQFLTSNWPSYDNLLDRRSVGFAFLVMIRFAIVYATIAGVFSTFVKVINWQKETRMRILDLIRERDLALKIKISQAVVETEPAQLASLTYAGTVIQQAINKADEEWATGILPARVGKEAAKKYLEK